MKFFDYIKSHKLRNLYSFTAIISTAIVFMSNYSFSIVDVPNLMSFNTISGIQYRKIQ